MRSHRRIKKGHQLRKCPTSFFHPTLLRVINGKCCLLLIASSPSTMDPKETFKRIPSWKHLSYKNSLNSWGPREGSSVGSAQVLPSCRIVKNIWVSNIGRNILEQFVFSVSQSPSPPVWPCSAVFPVPHCPALLTHKRASSNNALLPSPLQPSSNSFPFPNTYSSLFFKLLPFLLIKDYLYFNRNLSPSAENVKHWPVCGVGMEVTDSLRPRHGGHWFQIPHDQMIPLFALLTAALQY